MVLFGGVKGLEPILGSKRFSERRSVEQQCLMEVNILHPVGWLSSNATYSLIAHRVRIPSGGQANGYDRDLDTGKPEERLSVLLKVTICQAVVKLLQCGNRLTHCSGIPGIRRNIHLDTISDALYDLSFFSRMARTLLDSLHIFNCVWQVTRKSPLSKLIN